MRPRSGTLVFLTLILFFFYLMPSYLGTRTFSSPSDEQGRVGRCRHYSSFDSNSILCSLYTCAASVPFKARVCVSGERPRPFGRTHEASADRLARFPWASAAALSLPVSPHMRPRCRRESPLSHGLLLFRFPSSPSLSAAACALPIRRRFFRKALQPRYRRRRRLLLIPSYGIRIPRLLSLSPFPAAFSHPL